MLTCLSCQIGRRKISLALRSMSQNSIDSLLRISSLWSLLLLFLSLWACLYLGGSKRQASFFMLWVFVSNSFQGDGQNTWQLLCHWRTCEVYRRGLGRWRSSRLTASLRISHQLIRSAHGCLVESRDGWYYLVAWLSDSCRLKWPYLECYCYFPLWYKVDCSLCQLVFQYHKTVMSPSYQKLTKYLTWMIWESWAIQSLCAEKSSLAHAHQTLDFLYLAVHLDSILPLTLLGFAQLSLSILPQIHFLIFLEIFQK